MIVKHAKLDIISKQEQLVIVNAMKRGNMKMTQVTLVIHVLLDALNALGRIQISA